MKDVTFTVFMQPKGKARHRTANGRTYTPSKQVRWESQFALMASQFRPLEVMGGPLHVEIEAVFDRPKRLLRKKDPSGLILHDKKPDIDNIMKSVCDALNGTGWWRDDCQVATCAVRKFYAEKVHSARLTVTIKELENAQG